jgi:hypothetical protein
MDRSVMEGNPHSVIEGMLIAARAIGANAGYVYVRMEYPLAVKRIRKAVQDARACGFLGTDVFGSGLAFDLDVMEGAGAFVCGEETALLASIEGKRGMPMPKPPFPAECGLFGKPTVINNVETLASIPLIMQSGADQFRKCGTEKSPGTKTFALTGHVVNTGLIEVPFGATLREIVYNIGGGVIDDNGNLTEQPFKAVQIGGPSGGCLTEAHLDLPMDFDSLRSIGAMVGSGGLVVMNQNTCMVKIARFSCSSPRTNRAASVCCVARERNRCWRSSTTSSKGGGRWKPWTCSKNWGVPWARDRCAAWAKRRPTLSFRPCAISAPSTRRTWSRNAVRPVSAKRSPRRKFWKPSAWAVRPVCASVRWAPSPARRKNPTRSTRMSASSAARASRRAGLKPSLESDPRFIAKRNRAGESHSPLPRPR